MKEMLQNLHENIWSILKAPNPKPWPSFCAFQVVYAGCSTAMGIEASLHHGIRGQNLPR
jgi:hypothetical protein